MDGAGGAAYELSLRIRRVVARGARSRDLGLTSASAARTGADAELPGLERRVDDVVGIDLDHLTRDDLGSEPVTVSDRDDVAGPRPQLLGGAQDEPGHRQVCPAGVGIPNLDRGSVLGDRRRVDALRFGE